MENRGKQILRRKVFIFALWVLAGIGICIVLLAWAARPESLGYDIVVSLLTTLMSILVIGIIFQLYTNKEVNESVQQNILDSMAANPEVLKKYNSETVKDILNNCFPTLVGSFFSEQFVHNVVEKQINNVSYRKGFNYEVSIVPSEKSNHIIKQKLAYTKCLRQDKCLPKYAKMFFAFDESPFSFDDKESIVFFREVLTDNDLISRIRTARSDKERFKELRLSFRSDGMAMKLKSCDIITDGISDKGVLLTFLISKNQIKMDEGTLEFSGSMECEYPSAKQYFYCAFPEPTVDATFSISFEEGINLNNLSYDTFLSSENYILQNLEKGNGKILVPRTKNSIIFPIPARYFCGRTIRMRKFINFVGENNRL